MTSWQNHPNLAFGYALGSMQDPAYIEPPETYAEYRERRAREQRTDAEKAAEDAESRQIWADAFAQEPPL